MAFDLAFGCITEPLWNLRNMDTSGKGGPDEYRGESRGLIASNAVREVSDREPALPLYSPITLTSTRFGRFPSNSP